MIRKHIGWIVTCLITLVGWTWAIAGERSVTQERVGRLEARMQTIDSRYETTSARLGTIHLLLTQMQTDVKWVRHEVERLRDAD